MKQLYAFALLAFALSAASPSQAQSPRWSWAHRDANVTYSINPSYPRQVVAARAGRVLWGTVQNQRQLLNTMLGDYVIRELDTAGRSIASVTISGKLTLLQAAADAAGNWYLMGILSDSMKVGTAPLILQPGNGLGPDRFLLRLHAGTLAQDWFTMVGNDLFCSTESFMLDGSGIYLSVDSALSSRISRYDLNTGSRTTIVTQSTRSTVMSISRDDFGQLCVLGTCLNANTMNFNGTPVSVPANLNYPWYIVHYSANGTYDWHYFLNDITCTPRALSRVGGGGVFLSGDLYDTASIGTRHFQKAQNEDNYLVARLDNDGSVLWSGQRPVASVSQGSVSFGGATRSVAVDSLLITTPESSGPAIWGPGGIATSNSSLNGTVVAYNTGSGAARWAKGIDADYSNIQQVASDGNAVYITGVASDLSSINFDDVSIATTDIPWKATPYLARLYYGKPALSTDATVMLHGIVARPIPATKTLRVYTSSPEPMRILDALGREVWRGARGAAPELEIDVAGWARGIYILQQPAFGNEGIIKLVLR